MEYKFSTNLSVKVHEAEVEERFCSDAFVRHYRGARTFVLQPDVREAHEAMQDYWWKRFKAAKAALAKTRALHRARQPRNPLVSA